MTFLSSKSRYTNYIILAVYLVYIQYTNYNENTQKMSPIIDHRNLNQYCAVIVWLTHNNSHWNSVWTSDLSLVYFLWKAYSYIGIKNVKIIFIYVRHASKQIKFPDSNENILCRKTDNFLTGKRCSPWEIRKRFPSYSRQSLFKKKNIPKHSKQILTKKIWST